MDRIADGETAEAAVSSLAGFSSFESFKKLEKVFVYTAPVQQELTKSSISLDGEGGDFADDPVLQSRTTWKYVRVGDLLMEHKKYKAALVEYKKAKDPDEPMSPTALARMAECQFQLGDLAASKSQLTTALGLYPENVTVLLMSARLAPKVGMGDGHDYWLRAHEVNPYSIQTQSALIEHYNRVARTQLVTTNLFYLF